MSKNSLEIGRRELLIGIGALAIAPNFSFAKTVELGSKKVTSLSDGNLQLPVSFLFPEVDKQELSKLLTDNGLNAEALSPPCNLTLLEYDDKKVLFDAGAGPNFMSSAGKIFESLENLEIDPSDITDVIFTHGHPDHIWGIVDDFDEVSFPEANLHFPRLEWDYWRKDDTLEKTPEARKSFVVGARNRMDVMEERVQLFDRGAELLSGIETVDTSGHTPGHTSFAIHEGSNSVLVIGDAMTNHVVSFLKPDWPAGADQDTDKGIETRKRLLDRLSAEKTQIVGYHLPLGGVGYVEKKDTAYRFVPSG